MRSGLNWNPAPPALLTGPATVTLQATPADVDGTITRVEYSMVDGATTTLLGTVTAPPWSLTVSNLTRGPSFTATAYDDLGVASVPISAVVHFLGAEGDDFYRPFPLSGSHAIGEASNTNATRQPYERPFSNYTPSHSLWWEWTSPTNGQVVATTAGSSFDTVLGVYTGTNLQQQLTLVTSNDDATSPYGFSQVKWSALAGTRYRIMADGFVGQTGDVRLELQLDAATTAGPANDNFTNRIVVAGTNWVAQGDNTGATLESGERALSSSNPGGASVWWEWRSPGYGTVVVSTKGSAFDTILTVFRGPASSVSSLMVFTGNDDGPSGDLTSSVNFTATSNQLFYIRVEGWRAATGPLRLELQWESIGPGVHPVNDNFADRFVLTGSAAFDNATMLGATCEPGEPDYPSLINASLWWEWTATQTGPVQFSVTTTEGLRLDVFTGAALETLKAPPSAVRSYYKGRSLSFQALAGQTYFLRAAASNWSQNSLQIFLQCQGTTPPGALACSVLAEGNTFLLQYDAAASYTAVLESSDDLLDWVPLSTNTVAPGAVFAIPMTISPVGFFRLRMLD